MNDEAEARLLELEQPGHLGEPIQRGDVLLMAIVALILPIVLLAIAWGW